MKNEHNILYYVEIEYRFEDEQEIKKLRAYVRDSTWVFTCIPHDWRLSYMKFQIHKESMIVSRSCATILPAEENRD